MIIDFKNIEQSVMPNFKGGAGKIKHSEIKEK